MPALAVLHTLLRDQQRLLKPSALACWTLHSDQCCRADCAAYPKVFQDNSHSTSNMDEKATPGLDEAVNGVR